MKLVAIATMGGGCFWCVEAVVQRLRGVVSVTSGYTGGETENPSYKEICTGATGHAEVVQIEFDEKLIDYRQLLTVFMLTHDPTTLNRQGNDVGTQYRSAIYYHDEQQQTIAKEVIEDIDNSEVYGNPVVTEISPLGVFYAAESYHQNYFNQNPSQQYCMFVVGEKVAKARAKFSDLMIAE